MWSERIGVDLPTGVPLVIIEEVAMTIGVAVLALEAASCEAVCRAADWVEAC